MKRLINRASIAQQLNQRFTLFATFTVLVLLTVGFVLVINPEITEIRSFGIFHLQRTRAQRENVAESLRLTRSIVDSYKTINAQDVDKLQSVLPTAADLPAMFIQVEALALSSGLRLNNVSFTTASATRRETGTATTGLKETPSGFRQLQATFTVSGGHGYASLKNFLSTMESSVRLFDVQSLSYNPLKPGEEETYTINAISYYKGS